MTTSSDLTPGRTALRDIPLFALWPENERERVGDRFVYGRYPFGSSIVKEGDSADALFVIVSGTARVVKRGPNGEDVALEVLRPGDNFGEQGLLDHTTHDVTVRASRDLELLRLDRGSFDELLGERPELRTFFERQIRQRSLVTFLRLYTPFATLPVDDIRALVDGLEPLQVAAGTRVIQEGDAPGAMYIVRDGRLRVFQKVDGQRQYRAFLRPGDAFGARSALEQLPRWASVEAVDVCSLLVLPREAYARLLASRREFRTQAEALVVRNVSTTIARLPLDFSQENLPAETSVFAAVSPDQIDQPVAETLTPALAAPEAPFADDGLFVKRGKRIRTFHHVAQIDEMDCGAACIAMICRHYGRRVPLSRIRALSHTSLDGTSLRGLCRAASELGLAARAVKTSARHLAQMPVPAIVHWDAAHWVVLYDVSDTHVRIADPALGLRRLPRAEFEARWSGYAALFDYTGSLIDAATGELPGGMAWLLPFVRPYSRVLAQAVALALVVSALQMMFPVFMQVIVDSVLVERDVGFMNVLTVVMLGILAFMGAAIIVQRYLLSFVAMRVDSVTLDALTRTLLTLPMRYFSTRRTGDIQRRLAGLREIRQFCVEHGVALVASAAQLAAALSLMAIYSMRLTAVFLVTAPLYVLMMRFASRSLRPLYNALEDEYGKYQSYQVDAIKGIETVKSLGAENSFRELMLNNFHALARRRFRADFMMLTYDGGVQMVTLLTLILFLWMGARLVMAGNLTIGALVAFNALVAMANSPIASILSTWDNLQVAKVRLRRLDDVLQQEPEQGADHSRLVPVRTLGGRISFRNLEFRYGGPESPRILEDISFEVAPNTRVAIVGRSGSGKTTLIKCLAGMLEPTGGTILYDGVDLKTLNYRDLRRHIGFVLQENFLFSDTIARNIAFGEDEPDMQAVAWAAKAASADEFIERLPLGYDTKVGESGLAISAGQRQRIAIARALYHRPAILVFDEATSALDSETERAVTRSIDRTLEGRTSFVIAHRLSTVRDADQIIVLEQGRLAERGTHEELMQREGLYFHLVSQQLSL